MRGLAAALPILVALSACSSPLSGAGSMRVEVEVYKGPLSQSTDMQVGELAAVLAETVRSLTNWSDGARSFLDNHSTKCAIRNKSPYCATERQEVEFLKSAIQGSNEIIYSICVMVPSEVGISRPVEGNSTGPGKLNEKVADPNARFGSPARGPHGSEQAAIATSRQGSTASPAGALTGGEARSGDAGKGPGLKSTTPEDNTLNFVRKDACAREALYKSDDPRRLPPKNELGGTMLYSPMSMRTIRWDREELARRMATIAAEMKSKAFRFADLNVQITVGSREIRGYLTTFGVIVSEYSNQLQARLAVIEKQFDRSLLDARTDQSGKSGTQTTDEAMSKPTREARLLPVSNYLRDSRQTEFIRLFDWLQAGQVDNTAGLDTAERIRMAERLYSDYYWDKVNEVYASGQGNVGMAFIKDDLGNWNLKSFDNKPGDLLNSYTDAASAAVKAVAGLASKAVDPTGQVSTVAISQAEKLLGLANRLATGEDEKRPAMTGINIATMRRRAAERIRDARTRYVAQAEKVRDASFKDDAERDQAVKDLAAAASSEVRLALDDYLGTISVLQEGVAGRDVPAGGTIGVGLGNN